MSASVFDLQRLLYKPIDNSTPGQRLADILGGTETAAFTALSFGDIVYDRVSIDPNVLTAFDFRKPPPRRVFTTSPPCRVISKANPS